jgi:RNA polymerase sigma-70 factor (ECF subfamily)
MTGFRRYRTEDLVPIATSERLKSQSLPPEFDVLFREHYEFVHRTAYRVTGNFADAEDVVQTLFMRLCRHPLPPDIVSNPRGYLYKAAVNISLDVIRTRRRHPAESDEALLLNVPSAVSSSRGEEDLFARLRTALADLPSKAAEILILRHVHGYTDLEVSKFLGVSRSAIAVNLFRSRARLRRALRGDEGRI